MASENGVEQLDRLIRKLEDLLKDSENFQLLTVQQAVRMVRVFAYSEHVNMGRHRIIDKLIKYIESNLNQLEENDAINLLKAYQYINSDVPLASRLFNKLNVTISEQALSNPDDVSLAFAIRYLSVFYDLP